ncbi:MAG: beta-CASP ribonuclease aCPSF1 [Nanoarchaeota archaeon]|nr:beta-CASP ribonuclease aCPSF1 [Nanoarchaeota archaeon]
MVEEKTTDLFARVKDELPSDAKVSDIKFEGCEVVLYTKSKDFFLENNGALKSIVSKLKKRIILRPDPSICLDMEKAKIIIEKLIPKEAGLKEVTFEPAFSRVVIEADKPGLVIGKGGETLREIKKQILWFPQIKRAPAIPSDVVKVLRQIIHDESDFRKDFLNKVGKDIHSGWKETKWIRLTSLGGFREVGRSCILIQTPESRILLDCGIKPGNNEFPHLEAPEFDINHLNAVILSHAHMDHCGAVPLLYKMGYKGPLYCTTPTRDLMVLLCMDYIEIMQREGGLVPYSTKDIKEAVKHTICIDYDEVSDITPDVRLTLLNSGHIMGGSLIHLHIGNGLHNILYTGDYKFDRTALFEPASTNFARAETVITESTYGSIEDVQPRRDETESNLLEIVNETIKRGGKVLIPSFAVERSQDLMAILYNGKFKGTVYCDGMIWDATAIHTTYPEYFNRDLQKQILQQGENPFTDKMFKRIGSMKEREKILKSEEPCVIIATSGMLIAGPSVWWLKKLAEDEKSTLLFVGYQGEGSLGRRIQKGWSEIPMEEDGRTKSVPIKLEVKTITGLSGHSDIKQLMNYLKRLKQRPERIIVDHGESKKCVEFARNIHNTFRIETMAPKNLETIRLK